MKCQALFSRKNLKKKKKLKMSYADMVYHIQPNKHTVPLGFSKLLEKLIQKYIPSIPTSEKQCTLIK